jgi:hypothetical protein
MFEGWDEYYFMLGSSAAGLIGLLFIVATLTAGRERSTVETGSKLFTTPLVFHLGTVLLLSGAVLAPALPPTAVGLLGGAIAVAGLASCIRNSLGIAYAPQHVSHDWFDIWWYGIIPAGVYALLGGASALILTRCEWAPLALAAALMTLLLVTIHNAWDLVTYLARTPPPDDHA